jgi:hypothetical protein
LGLVAGVKASGWSRRFEVPISLDDGRKLVTLVDAGQYIMGLSPTAKRKSHWQTAAGELVIAAEVDGDVMHAEIAMRRALVQDRP